jgi:SAM-dependent methyltransferase
MHWLKESMHVEIPARVRARRDVSVESAVYLINHLCEHLGLDDLGATELLDVGCGVKFTRAFLAERLPIKRYTGVDVDAEMIAFLRSNVDDPRLEYVHVDVHNDLYNPDGEPLNERSMLPLRGRIFDVICLFSVFTHLAPADFALLLRLLRPYVDRSGRLFFTLYINELTDDGHGLMDSWLRKFAARDEFAGVLGRMLDSDVRSAEPFVDLDPKQPLKWAVYSEEYARSLIEQAGWRVLSLSPPGRLIQHHFVCAPAAR